MFRFLVPVLVLASIISAADLPKYVPRCHLDDPEFHECMVEATETMRPYIKKGMPELDFPSLDPLRIPSISINQGTPAINVQISLKNVVLNGLADYEFQKWEFDPKKMRFYGMAKFPKLSMEADYGVDGKILVAPIRGKGKFMTVLGLSTGAVQTHGELVTLNGDQYIETTKVKATIGVSNFTNSFDGLFGGNEELTMALKSVLEENRDELVKEMLPAVEKVAEELVLKMMNGIFKKFPYNKVFPTSNVY